MVETFHIAAQYLTTVAISFLEKKDDDSHTNLGWKNGALHTHPLSELNCRLSLDYRSFSLIWSNDVGFKESIDLDGKTHIEIVRWIRQTSLKAKKNLVYEYDLHFELPYEKITGDFIFQQPSETITQELIQKRNLVQQALEKTLQKEISIRVWPHHFDTGAFFIANDELGIGLGMAIPDSLINDFYLYVSGYHRHNAVELPAQTTLEKGSYYSEGWKGFALPVSEITEAEAMTFLQTQSTNTRNHKILLHLKTHFLSAIFCTMFSLVLSAQVEPPTIMPGLSGVYSSELETLGWNARLYYAADHHYCFGPEISYFKKNIEDGEVTFFEANANLHYIIDLDGGLGFYPLSGINYSVEREIENHTTFQEKHTKTAWGLNVGGGFHYAKGRLLFFTEYKYVISELDDHFFTLGCLINFSLAKKNKEKHEHK